MDSIDNLRYPTRFFDLCELLREGETNFRIADPPRNELQPGLHPFNERLIQLIWKEQLLRPDALQTAEGIAVKVFDPGRWNGEAGPDFKNADLLIGTRRLRGDVEIHIQGHDWYHHDHDCDFEYNNVVLHVQFYPGEKTAVSLQYGATAPCLFLEPVIEPDLETIRQTFADDSVTLSDDTANNLPGCADRVAGLSQESLYEFLEEAAKERLESRIERFCHRRNLGNSPDEILYQALMTSMGSKGGKTLYYLLSKRVPVEELRIFTADSDHKADACESILLHVAGLLDTGELPVAADDMFDENETSPLAADEATNRYLEQMYREWEEFRPLYTDRMIPPTRRWFSGIRPVNFPTRRLAGIARILRNIPRGVSLTDYFYHAVRTSEERQPKTASDFKREITALASLLTPEDTCYWSRRFTVGGKTVNVENRLIGKDRALSLAYNALIPFLIMRAREMKDTRTEKYLVRLHRQFPALPSNTVTKYMKQRLFGTVLPPGLTFRLEWQNQALFQIFYSCCTNPDLTCAECVFCKN